MNVGELIQYLHQFPQEMLVAYQIYSEQELVKVEDIQVLDKCAPRPDGWVHDARPDMPTQKYLVFPGN